MFEEYTRDAIRQTILDNTDNIVSQIEGSFVSDMSAPVALEISKLYAQLDMLLNMFFAVSATGDYLTEMAYEHGVDRTMGTKATGSVTFSGTDDTVIPAGTAVLTESGLQYTTNAEATISSGTATVGVTAAAVGSAYNVSAGRVTQLYRGISGVTGVTNSASITGGTDTETDKSLQQRLIERMRKPATSGNVWHYRQWALEVSGVTLVKVIPLFDGTNYNVPGKVRVVVGGPSGSVTTSVKNAVAAHIEEVRPIGADVTVESAAKKNINVEATITTDGSRTLAEITDDFNVMLQEYFDSIALVSDTVSYQRIGFLLLSVLGVTGYSTLTVNSGTANVSLTYKQLPWKNTVTINA